MRLALLLALPVIARGQPAPTIKLVVDAKVPLEWTTVRGVRELKDGRVIVLDSRDQAVKLVDFESGSASMIGRKGSGPGEYQLPLALFALPGDSSVVFDMANSGAPLVITPAGKAGDPLPGMRAEGAVGFLNVGGKFDARGRIYRRGYGITIGRDPIERLDRATARIDTVAFFDGRVISPLRPLAGPGGERPKVVRAGKPVPFASLRQFAVTTNGTVILLSPEPYRVSFVDGGKQTDGPVISYERLRVTDADKAAWRAERAKPVAAIMYNRDGSQTAGYRQPPPADEPDAWPDFLPPYAIRGVLVDRIQVAPNGAIWIERAIHANSPPLYDVLTSSGALSYRVTLPARTRIVGFGAKGIYAVTLDDDDIEHLERFRFPPMNNR
jgi:hypothetical protein